MCELIKELKQVVHNFNIDQLILLTLRAIRQLNLRTIACLQPNRPNSWQENTAYHWDDLAHKITSKTITDEGVAVKDIDYKVWFSEEWVGNREGRVDGEMGRE